jgi:hypothetical protein
VVLLFTLLLLAGLSYNHQDLFRTMACAQVLRQPNITYHPNFDQYKARSQRRQKAEQLPTSLPGGFPKQLSSPLVWEGKDVEGTSDWIFELNESQLDEIHQALQKFKCKYQGR